jgi:hypothetical protein
MLRRDPETAPMPIMSGKIYAALKAAGAPDDAARAAAEDVGDLHDQFGGFRSAMHELHADLKGELRGLRGDVRNEFGEMRNDVHTALSELRSDFRGELTGVRGEVAYLRGRFDVLLWAVGINAAATIAILGVLLRH